MNTKFPNWFLGMMALVALFLAGCDRRPPGTDAPVLGDSHSNAGSGTDAANVGSAQLHQQSPEITLGAQVWMTSNLDVTTFRNGDSIMEAATVKAWRAAIDQHKPAWCNYGNDSAIGARYGKLYNVFAVMDPRGLAPNGWHIARESDWLALVDSLGGNHHAGDPMKCTHGWEAPSSNAHKLGFCGLPSGYRNSFGDFKELGLAGNWWVFPAEGQRDVLARGLRASTTLVHTQYRNLSKGFSVRCVRD